MSQNFLSCDRKQGLMLPPGSSGLRRSAAAAGRVRVEPQALRAPTEAGPDAVELVRDRAQALVLFLAPMFSRHGQERSLLADQPLDARKQLELIRDWGQVLDLVRGDTCPGEEGHALVPRTTHRAVNVWRTRLAVPWSLVEPR